MVRARNRIRPGTGIEQCGFIENTGARNAISTVHMLSERAIEMQEDMHMGFIDYTRAFDKIKHEDLLKVLECLFLNGKNLRLIRNVLGTNMHGNRLGDG